jgi:hypothetical protein
MTCPSSVRTLVGTPSHQPARRWNGAEVNGCGVPAGVVNLETMILQLEIRAKRPHLDDARLHR